jgi:hypothetical protein
MREIFSYFPETKLSLHPVFFGFLLNNIRSVHYNPVHPNHQPPDLTISSGMPESRAAVPENELQ